MLESFVNSDSSDRHEAIHNGRIWTNQQEVELFYTWISKIMVPLLHKSRQWATALPRSLPASHLPASEPALGILQNKHITNVGRFKSFRNHIRLIDKTSTALFRNNSKSAYARHSFSTTPPPYVATATSLLHLSNVRNGPMGSMDQWIIGWGSGITRTSFLLFFVGMLSRYPCGSATPSRGGSTLFRRTPFLHSCSNLE